MRQCHVVINVLRKPILSGPLEFDIVTVRDMSEIATENKVYSFGLWALRLSFGTCYEVNNIMQMCYFSIHK